MAQIYLSIEAGVSDISSEFLHFLLQVDQLEFGVALGAEEGGRATHRVEGGQSQELILWVFGGCMRGKHSCFDIVMLLDDELGLRGCLSVASEGLRGH